MCKWSQKVVGLDRSWLSGQPKRRSCRKGCYKRQRRRRWRRWRQRQRWLRYDGDNDRENKATAALPRQCYFVVSFLETFFKKNRYYCKVHTVTRHRVHQRHEMERRAAFVLLGMLYLAGTLVTVQAGETYPFFRIIYYSIIHLFVFHSLLYHLYYYIIYYIAFIVLSNCIWFFVQAIFSIKKNI